MYVVLRTIHEPSTSIRRNVTLADDEIQVCQNLYYFQDETLPFHAINLKKHMYINPNILILFITLFFSF